MKNSLRCTLLLAVSVLSLASSEISSAAPTEGGSPNIVMTTANCNGDSAKPTAVIRSWPWATDSSEVPSIRPGGDGIYQFSYNVPPGHYFILVRSNKCRAMASVAVLEGYKRHVVAKLWPLVAYDYYGTCAIAGTLPIEGLSLGVMSSGRELPVASEGGMFDLEGIGPGSHTLRLHVGILSREISVNIPVLKRSDRQRCQSLLVRNITLDDVREAGQR